MHCQKCRAPVAPDFAFCENCGWPIRPPAAAAPADASEQQVIAGIAACASHRGRKYPDNQDAAGLRLLPDGAVVMVVADGVSTACHSRRAADTAVQQVLDTIAAGDHAAPRALLERAVGRAHAALCELPHDDPQRAEPQATVAVALVLHGVAWYAWVGDSRVYLLQAEGSRQLSADDSWLNDRLREGMPYDAAMADANAHCITQCLGMRDDEPVIHVAGEPMPPDAWLLLCSDGLWNYFDQAADLWLRVNGAGMQASPLQRCTELVDHANRAGGADNITVALYRLSPRAAATP